MEPSATETLFVQRATYLLPSELIYRVKDVADAEGLTENLVAQLALEEYIERLDEARRASKADSKQGPLPLVGDKH